MHLKPDADIPKFLLSIKKCQGGVYFESQEGDLLNLASALSQYIFCSVVGQSYDWSRGVIRCEIPEDTLILSAYLEIE